MAETRTSYLVGRADRLLRSILEECLADHPLTLNEVTALSVLASRPGLSNAGLARRSVSSFSRLPRPPASTNAIACVESLRLRCRSIGLLLSP